MSMILAPDADRGFSRPPVVRFGPLADRPDPDPANEGQLYFDGSTLWSSTGSTWDALGDQVVVGSTPGTVAAGDDARLSDARTPTSHAGSHGVGGADQLYIYGGHSRTNAVENGPRWAWATTVNAISSGRQYLLYFTPGRDLTITQMAMYNAGAAVGATLVRMGLYTVDVATGDLTLVARTANDVTLFATINLDNARAFDTAGGFPASYPLLVGVRYAFSFIVVGASPTPTIYGPVGVGGPNTSPARDTPPYMVRFNSGSPTDLPATLLFSGTTGQTMGYYVAGLA